MYEDRRNNLFTIKLRNGKWTPPQRMNAKDLEKHIRYCTESSIPYRYKKPGGIVFASTIEEKEGVSNAERLT